MPGNNAALRVKVLTDRVQSVPNTMTMVDGLKKLFAVEPLDVERDLARRIEALHLQLDLAESELRAASFPDELFVRQFRKLREAFRAALLQQQFSHVRSTVDEAATLCLAWCAFALADEGASTDRTAANAAVKQLEELLASPFLSKLPPALRDLFSVHLRAILDALSIVDIAGAAPLQKAAKAAATDLVLHADEVDSAAQASAADQSSYIKKCGAVMKWAMEAAATGGKGAEGVEKVIKLVTERGPKLLEGLSDVAKQIGI